MIVVDAFIVQFFGSIGLVFHIMRPEGIMWANPLRLPSQARYCGQIAPLGPFALCMFLDLWDSMQEVFGHIDVIHPIRQIR